MGWSERSLWLQFRTLPGGLGQGQVPLASASPDAGLYPLPDGAPMFFGKDRGLLNHPPTETADILQPLVIELQPAVGDGRVDRALNRIREPIGLFRPRVPEAA
jgi:hypothetical protein